MKLPKRLRTFNKYLLNRIPSMVARSAYGPVGIVYHVGRRSGKAYETTIIINPLPDGFLISLPYGADVDWYRNVVAAGRCRVLWHKREYEIAGIEPVAADVALPLLPQPERTILRRLGIMGYAILKFAGA